MAAIQLLRHNTSTSKTNALIVLESSMVDSDGALEMTFADIMNIIHGFLRADH